MRPIALELADPSTIVVACYTKVYPASADHRLSIAPGCLCAEAQPHIVAYEWRGSLRFFHTSHELSEHLSRPGDGIAAMATASAATSHDRYANGNVMLPNGLRSGSSAAQGVLKALNKVRPVKRLA